MKLEEVKHMKDNLVEFNSKNLREYVLRLLGKKDDDTIRVSDLSQIKSLKLDRRMFRDLTAGDLAFFSELTSLSLNNLDIGKNEIKIINNLKNLQTLSISNSQLSKEGIEYLNPNLKSLIFVRCKGLDIGQFNKNGNVKKLTIINCEGANLKGISQIEGLEKVNLANNEWMQDEDIEDLWDAPNLEEVNLDGNPNITDAEHKDISVSHKAEYTPGESIDWNNESRQEHLYSNAINVRADDLKLPETKTKLTGKAITLTLRDTSELSSDELKELRNKCNISRVYIETGWQETQNRGYSIDTYLAIKDKMEEITGDIDNQASEQERYLRVRDKIINNISYDYSILEVKPNERDFYASRNLENGLLNGTCVCAGYADIMKNALAEVGIESKYVEGMTTGNELHAWIQVKIDGVWYNDDITWDATNRSSGKNGYKYCMMTDEEFGKTHSYAIPQRTEGHGVNQCRTQAPAAVNALRKGKGVNQVFNSRDDRDNGDGRIHYINYDRQI